MRLLSAAVTVAVVFVAATTAVAHPVPDSLSQRGSSPSSTRGGTDIQVPDPVPGRLVPDDTRIRTYAAPCKDLVLIGARGSGEEYTDGQGLGKPVNAARKSFISALENRVLPRDIAFGFIPVSYPAQNTSALWNGQIDAYFDGLADGMDQTIRWLKARHEKCPDERLFLGGYSQGAMVMHRVVRELSKVDYRDVRRSVIGAIAIADGDRWRDDGGRPFGTSHTNSWRDRGIAMIAPKGPGFRGARQGPLPRWIRHHWFSVCDAGDLVCDTLRALGVERAGLPARPTFSTVVRWLISKGARVKAGMDVHTRHYQPGSGVRYAMQDAVFARDTLPNVIRTAQLPQPQTGDLYRAQLSASEGRSGTWSLSGGTLPIGLNLAADGVISGTPTAHCVWCVITVQFDDAVNGTTYSSTLPMFADCRLLERDRGGDAVARLATIAINTNNPSILDGCYGHQGVKDEFSALLASNVIPRPLRSPAPCELDSAGAFVCAAEKYDFTDHVSLYFNSGTAGFLLESVTGGWMCSAATSESPLRRRCENRPQPR